MIARNGFTLVEMLAALLAGSIILITLSWSIASLASMYRPAVTPVREAEFASATDALELLLEPLRPGAVEAGPTYLKGTTSPPMAIGGGAADVELRISRRKTGQALVATLRPNDRRSAEPEARPEPQVLLAEMRTIRLDYGETASASGLPAFIRVTARAFDGVDRQIVIVPRITSDGSCRFDPITMACR